jgi:spermidine synthase
MAMWFEERYRDRVRFALKVVRQRYHGRSEFQSIDVFETEALGAALALDGVFQTSVADEFVYHEMLVHPALTTARSIKNFVVIGGGDGGSATPRSSA